MSPRLSSSSCPSLLGQTIIALLAFVLVFVFLPFAFALLVCLFISMALITQLLRRSYDTVTSLIIKLGTALQMMQLAVLTYLQTLL